MQIALALSARRKVTAAISASLLAITATTIVFAIGSMQDHSNEPGVSLEPAHARAGDPVTASVRDIPGAQDGYQVYLIPVGAIQEETDRTQGCVTQQYESIEPLHLGTTQRYPLESAVEHRATGQLPYSPRALPEGQYHPCVTWITDGELRHWAAAAKLRIIGSINFSATEQDEGAINATITGGTPSTTFTIYEYDKAGDQGTCSGGFVLARGETDAAGNDNVQIFPLNHGLSAGDNICAGKSDGSLMAYGTLDTLPGGDVVKVSPESGPRWTNIRLTAKQTWPATATQALAYLEHTPPSEGQCNGAVPDAQDSRRLSKEPITNGLVVFEFTANNSQWQAGRNVICVRWLDANHNPGNVEIKPALVNTFFMTATSAGNTETDASPPGAPIGITSTDLPAGSKLIRMQWADRQYPEHTFSNPDGTFIVPPLELHVDESTEPVSREITLYWKAPNGTRPTSVMTLYLKTVQIVVDGPHNSASKFTVAMTGIDPQRGMKIHYCQAYGNQAPPRIMAEGTAEQVEVDPSNVQNVSRLRRGSNQLCAELDNWTNYGRPTDYLNGVHPAIATFVYEVRPGLLMAESAIIGTTVDAIAIDLPAGASLKEFMIDGVLMARGSAYDASGTDQLGRSQLRFIMPSRVGNISTANRTLKAKAVYLDADDEIEVTGEIKALPATPQALASVLPPGQLAGVPYLTFRPRSAVVNQLLTVRTRNLNPRDATLRAVKLNWTLVYGEADGETARPGTAEYLQVRVIQTLGQQTVQFTVPAKIGDHTTENSIHVELHWDPGEDDTDPYGNQLIIVSREIQLFTQGEKVELEECNAITRLEPEQLRAGAPVEEIRLRVATGQFNRPMNCPLPGTKAGTNTIPEGDITIRLQGDFQVGQFGVVGANFAGLGANVVINIIEAEILYEGHEQDQHTHGQLPPVVQPENLVTVYSVSATSITLSPGPLIRGKWSYRHQLINERTQCIEVPATKRLERIANLMHGTTYTLEIFNRPSCEASANSGTITFTTTTGASSYQVQAGDGIVEVKRRGDAMILNIPGCEEWIDEIEQGFQTYDGCYSAQPRFIEFIITIPTLSMPQQATRDPDERIIFTVEWEKQGLIAHHHVHAYTTTDRPQLVQQDLDPNTLTPPIPPLTRENLSFHRYSEQVGINAYGHVLYTDVEIHTAHDGGYSESPESNQNTSSASFQGCAQLLSSGIRIPSSQVFATENGASTQVDTRNGRHSRVGLYHVCARDGGGITTSDAADGLYRARFVVGMSAEPAKSDQDPSAGQTVRIRLNGYEAVRNSGEAHSEEALIIRDITIGGRRLAGPVSTRPKTWQNWNQENQILELMLPPELQGNANIELWAKSPENSIDRTCTANVPGRNPDLEAIYESACYFTFNVKIQPPAMILRRPTTGMRINEEGLAEVSGLPGSQICRATVGPLPITLLNEEGRPTDCVDLSPNGQDSLFRFAMRTPNEGPQTQMVRYYVLNAGEGQTDSGAQGGSQLSVVTDLNARASTEINLLPPKVSLLNSGTVRRLDKLVLRGEDFPRAKGANYKIDITIGDCTFNCKQRSVSSVRLWEFDHILRRQPRPPGEEILTKVTLAGVELEVEGSVASPAISMEIYPPSGQADDRVTVSVQGLEAYKGGYSVHIQRSNGRGPAIIFQTPPQTDGRGEFNVSGTIPWWEHDGGTAEYETILQLYDGERNEVQDAMFIFLYTNREAPATPRPTPPATTEVALQFTTATPRPARLGIEPTAIPAQLEPTPTVGLTLSTATPQPTPTPTPHSVQPIRSLAELIQEKEPTPTVELTPTPEPIILLGQSPTVIEPADEEDGPSPWVFIAAGTLLLLLAIAAGIAVLIWKRPQEATVTPMGRVSEDEPSTSSPQIMTGRGYLDDEWNSPQATETEESPQEPKP